MGPSKEQIWRAWVDTGGTFTDCLAQKGDGPLERVKVLSSSELRLRLREQKTPRRLVLADALPKKTDALLGCHARPLEAPRPKNQSELSRWPRVVGVDSERGALFLSDDLLDVSSAVALCADEEAPTLACRLLTGTPVGESLPPLQLRLATTRATNALLERKGAQLVLFVTAGFGDLLEIRTQARPDLFATRIVKPRPLHAAVVEVRQRLDARGNVLCPLDEAALEGHARAALEQLRCSQPSDQEVVAAVALAHSYRQPAHEARCAEILSAIGYDHICLSSTISPLINLLWRAETAVVDAYLTPSIASFLRRISASMSKRSSSSWVMTSTGGLSHVGAFRARDSLLSGPAGGVVGAKAAGESLRRCICGGRSEDDHPKDELPEDDELALLTFDMGGTSTDVARYAGKYEYRTFQQVGDVRLNANALAIESVAAGGGSICGFENGRLFVGPQSASAHPGPACYGAGGPLTLTDVNLLLGRLDPTRFGIPVDTEAAERALRTTQESLTRATGQTIEHDALLDGFLEIANEKMAEAIRRVSVQRGFGPQNHTLVAFGGAGPQHACAIADRLGITRVLVPADAGLLSARGLTHAAIESVIEHQVLTKLNALQGRLAPLLAQLEARALAALEKQSAAKNAQRSIERRIAAMRFIGQDSTVSIELPAEPSGDPGNARLAARFFARYRELYGHLPKERDIEIESVRVIARVRESLPFEAGQARESRPFDAGQARESRPFEAGQARESRPFDAQSLDSARMALAIGQTISGPKMVVDAHCTTIVEPGWSLSRQADDSLLLTRDQNAEQAGKPETQPAQPAAVALELFANRLGAIAEQMGEMLRRTALSTNVKERLDFSCAVVDAAGQLVVNAPHIPVHLGSLGICVREVVKKLPLAPGDVAITNHPAYGGSHLPDVTVIAPVHFRGELIGYVANRAHHAEIGGIRPGSMPPEATSLQQEGVVIAPMLLLCGGEDRLAELRRVLTDAPFPTRAVEENIADIEASLAAVALGQQALVDMATRFGKTALASQMGALADLAARLCQDALSMLPPGRHTASDTLDDGTPLCVTIEQNGDSAHIDFTGSAGQHTGNLNATPAIVHSAVLYALRLLLDRPLPLNEGLMRPVTVTIPEGLLCPHFPIDDALAPAVVGGNVETSQRLVDLLLAAFGVAAHSQGTMNNTLFGNERFGYYETVCGGAGAGPGFQGADAVHTHMTNTHITDVEVLEHRYPVRLERFCIRHASGGLGQYRGGDGVIRELRFLQPLSLSLLTQRRVTVPRGLAGGHDGSPGRQTLISENGARRELEPICGIDVQANDRLLLETPGGGGYGEPR
jgi:5-oxoprolinase (ATP-hydrolysing)